MRSAPLTSSSRRGTSTSSAWSQLVSTKATNDWRASPKLAIASRTTTSSTLRDSLARTSSSARSSGRPRRATCSSSDASTYNSAPATSSRADSSAGRCPVTISCIASRCCITTPRAMPRPIMPRVSLTRPRASTCGRRSSMSVLPVRRCRSSESLTRNRSSLIAAETVSSSARLRPLRLPRACSISDSLGSWVSSSKVRRRLSSAGWPPWLWATW